MLVDILGHPREKRPSARNPGWKLSQCDQQLSNNLVINRFVTVQDSGRNCLETNLIERENIFTQ